MKINIKFCKIYVPFKICVQIVYVWWMWFKLTLITLLWFSKRHLGHVALDFKIYNTPIQSVACMHKKRFLVYIHNFVKLGTQSGHVLKSEYLLVLPRYIDMVIYIVTWRYIMIWYKDKALSILYLVIRNTEILPELGCWSSINALH